MIAIPILLCVVVLQTPMAVDSKVQNLPTDILSRYCRNILEYGNPGLSAKDRIIADINSLYTYIVHTLSLLPDTTTEEENLVFLREKHCADGSPNNRLECFFLLAWDIMNDNPDWEQLQLESNPDALKIYVRVWFKHPLIGHFCMLVGGSGIVNSYPLAQLLQGIADQKAIYAKMLTKTESQTTKLRQEMKKICKINSNNNFCPGALDIIKLVDVYNAVKDEDKEGVKWNAFLLYFVYLKHNIPTKFSDVYPSDEETDQLVLNDMEQIFTFLNNGQYTELKDMMTVVPNKFLSSSCKNIFNLAKTARNVCMLGLSTNSIQAYFKSQVPPENGQVRKILKTNIDYQIFASQTDMQRILSVVQNQQTASTDLAEWVNSEVQKGVNNRFLGLQQFYQNVAKFNTDKSKADVDFINDRLVDYRSEVSTLSNDLARRLTLLIQLACTSVAAEIAEDTIKVGISLAENLNPLGKIFGGSSVGELLDRTAKLANSLTAISEMVKVADSFKEVRRKVNDISTKLGNNAEFLDNLNDLIQSIASKTSSLSFDAQKQKFLDDYTAYNPEVKKPELTAMTTTYVNLIEACCDVIMNTETTLAAVPKGEAKRLGLCPKAKEVAAEMIETFAEIYDFQFDLIEAMASYMGATTSINSAKDINAYYGELSSPESPSDEVISQLKILTSVAYITFKIDILQIHESYCDVLTYKEGGNQPSVCQGIEKSVPAVLAYTSPKCRNVEANKDVPISSTTDQGFMNIFDLYAGKPVTFQIPNSQWLVDNGWISAQDKDFPILVKKFEVFLPTQSSVQRSVRVNAKVIGNNKLSTSSDTSYVIVPKRELIFDYLEGTGSEESCRQASQVLNNPYGPSLPKLCRLNVDENNCQEILEKTRLFPSVYARWKIALTGYESSIPVTSVNDDFVLRVGVRLCILNPTSPDQGINTKKRGSKAKKWLKKAAKRKDKERQSCPDGEYWSKKANGCAPCPEGSRPALDGYFCEKIPEEMS